MTTVEKLFIRPSLKYIQDLCYVKGCQQSQMTGSHLCEAHREEAINKVARDISRSPIAHLKRDINTPAGLCWVYFVGSREEGVVKIGMTSQLNKRMRSLRNTSPIPIKLFSVFLTFLDTEEFLHNHFAEHRKHGEWFTLTPEIDEAMTALVKGERPEFFPEDLIPTDNEIVELYFGTAA